MLQYKLNGLIRFQRATSIVHISLYQSSVPKLRRFLIKQIVTEYIIYMDGKSRIKNSCKLNNTLSDKKDNKKQLNLKVKNGFTIDN